MPHHHNKSTKSVSPTSTKLQIIRSLPLLILILYTAVSIIKLDSTSSPTTLDSLAIEKSDPFKTHISSSNHHHLQAHEEKRAPTSTPCSSFINGNVRVDDGEGFICCDRSNFRTDVCYVRGDVRTSPGAKTIHLHGASPSIQPQTIKPYTRKWEREVMDRIDNITLRPVSNGTGRCDVHHRGVPAILFSAGGYTGNVYHEFNDGLIPLYLTAARFDGEVVLVVLEYQSWWHTKYKAVLKRLSRYRVVNLAGDRRVHCFGEMIVGLKIHGDLSIEPQLMPKGIHGFQTLLGQGLGGPHPPSPSSSPPPPVPVIRNYGPSGAGRPKISIFIRHKSRVLYNTRDIIKTCQRIGFEVQTLDPKRTTPMADIYAALNSSDAMLAVHGAAMTHLLFMRPRSVLIQIVPLGLDWPAETYYGEPAKKLGLEYMAYRVAPEESSLLRFYDRSDPVIADPGTITSKGWSETKRVYLDRQNVRVNMKRFGKLLEKAHAHVT